VHLGLVPEGFLENVLGTSFIDQQTLDRGVRDKIMNVVSGETADHLVKGSDAEDVMVRNSYRAETEETVVAAREAVNQFVSPEENPDLNNFVDKTSSGLTTNLSTLLFRSRMNFYRKWSKNYDK